MTDRPGAPDLCVVVGATGSFGRAVTERLVGRGQRVLAVGRNAEELEALRRSLGLEPGEPVPPKLRHHVKRLGEDQTRRRRRAVRDSLDRAMIDVMGLFRDVLRVQLGADGELINEHRRDEIEAYARGAAGDSAEVLARIDAVTTARERIAANVPMNKIVQELIGS